MHTDSLPERAAIPTATKRSIGRLVVGVLLALAASLLLVYLLRNPIATRVLAWTLDHKGNVSCSHPDVTIASSLSRISVAPVQCVILSGPLREVTMHSDTLISMTGTHVQSVEIAKATFDQRERDISNVDTDAASALAQFVGFGDELIKGLLDSSELYSIDSPPVLIEELTMKRAGKKQSLMHGFEKTVDGEWDRSHARRVQSTGGAGTTVRDLDMRVTPTRGKLTANVYLGTPKAAEAPDVKLRLEGRHLNGPRPSFTLDLDANVKL
jgi:hypothetical protein